MEMSNNSMIAITGSQGLIGKLLVNKLQQMNIPIMSIDQRLTSTCLGSGDICNKKWLKQLLIDCKGIIHLAGISRVVYGEKNPELCWEVNVTGTQNILEIAFESSLKPWIIYASSREVYGQQINFPVSENALLQPMNIYAKSKVAAENLVNCYRDKGLKTAILRFSSVYGSRDDYADRVVPAFCLNALQNKLLRIDGLENKFDFTHVSDVVSGIIQTINYLENSFKEIPTVHLTTGIGTTLLEITKIIGEILGKNVSYHEAPKRTYDVHQFWGNPALANKLLNWQAKISLKDGISNLLQHYQTLSNKEEIL